VPALNGGGRTSWSRSCERAGVAWKDQEKRQLGLTELSVEHVLGRGRCVVNNHQGGPAGFLPHLSDDKADNAFGEGGFGEPPRGLKQVVESSNDFLFQNVFYCLNGVGPEGGEKKFPRCEGWAGGGSGVGGGGDGRGRCGGGGGGGGGGGK